MWLCSNTQESLMNLMDEKYKDLRIVDHSVLSVVTCPSGESNRIVHIERFVFVLDKEMCHLYVETYVG